MRLRDLWGETDPYAGIEPNNGKLTGFHVRCPLLERVVRESGAKRILETGAHCGASAIWMAEVSGGEVLTCDTWAVDADLFGNPRRRAKFVRAFDTFRKSVVAHGMQDRVIYLPMTSAEMFRVCDANGLTFGMAYIDGGHSYEICRSDIREAAKITDGPIVVDDVEEGRFDGVVRAVSEWPGRIYREGRKAVLERR